MTFDRAKGRGAKYGAEHIKARREAAQRHQPWHLCTRCRKPLGPMGPHLHYDHAENGTYLGFAHGTCNVKAGASKGARIVNARKGRPRPKRRLTW